MNRIRFIYSYSLNFLIDSYFILNISIIFIDFKDKVFNFSYYYFINRLILKSIFDTNFRNRIESLSPTLGIDLNIDVMAISQILVTYS